MELTEEQKDMLNGKYGEGRSRLRSESLLTHHVWFRSQELTLH